MSAAAFTRRRFVASGLALAAAGALAADARPKRRLGLLLGNGDREHADYLEQLDAALRVHGWTRGRNLEFVVRYAGAPEAEREARELAAGHVDAILTGGTPRTLAVLGATRTIPVVTEVADPVASGIVASLSAPGRNVTGMAYQPQEVTDKQLEMLAALVKGLAEVRLVTLSPLPSPAEFVRARGELVRPLQSAARRQGLALEVSIATDSRGIAKVISAMRPGRSAAYFPNLVDAVDPRMLAAEAIEHRIATFHLVPEFVEAGGLMSYGFDFGRDGPTRSAAVLAKVLDGEDPAAIPFELPREQRFVLNLRTARALGIEIAPEILVRANRVIG